jgi:hypothetical protein
MSTDWDQRVADAMADEGIVYAPVDPAETFAEEPEHYGERPDEGDDESHKPEHIASPMPPRRLLVVGRPCFSAGSWSTGTRRSC